MALKKWRLLEQGVESQHAPFADLEAGQEFEHDFGGETEGRAPDVERAVIAAGWVEPVEEKTTKKKEG